MEEVINVKWDFQVHIHKSQLDQEIISLNLRMGHWTLQHFSHHCICTILSKLLKLRFRLGSFCLSFKEDRWACKECCCLCFVFIYMAGTVVSTRYECCTTIACCSVCCRQMLEKILGRGKASGIRNANWDKYEQDLCGFVLSPGHNLNFSLAL